MHTHHLITALIAAVLFLSSPSAQAQVPSPFRRTPPGEDVITPLHAGTAAPHDGVLLDLDTAKRWTSYLEQAQGIVQQEQEKHDRLMAVELRRIRETYALQIESKNRQLVQALQRTRELEETANRPVPFYRTVWFGAAAGASLTAIAGALLVLAVSR